VRVELEVNKLPVDTYWTLDSKTNCVQYNFRSTTVIMCHNSEEVNDFVGMIVCCMNLKVLSLTF
jgi:hypothetical protein